MFRLVTEYKHFVNSTNLGAMTLSITILSIMTLSMTILSIMTLSITILSIMTLSITILSIMTFSLMTHSIKVRHVTLSITMLCRYVGCRVFLLLCRVSLC